MYCRLTKPEQQLSSSPKAAVHLAGIGSTLAGVGDASYELPMFPLQNVILPGTKERIQVFEARYLKLLEFVLKNKRRFGTVLISRGSEIGGGDERYSMGSQVIIEEVKRADEDSFMLTLVGQCRLKIDQWLSEEPYPLAQVTPIANPYDENPLTVEQRDLVRAKLYKLSTMAGDAQFVQLADNEEFWQQFMIQPDEALFVVSALLGFGAWDRYKLLTAEGGALELLLGFMDEFIELNQLGKN